MREKKSRWHVVRHTKAGRPVSEMRLRESSALSGIGAWITRRRINQRLAGMRPDRYSYSFRVTATWRFRGERRVYHAEYLDVDLRGKDFRDRADLSDLHRLNPRLKFVPRMNSGTFDIRRTIIHDLIISQNATLGESDGKRYKRTNRKGLKKKPGNRGYKREYAVFKLGLVVERIPRDIVRKPRKKKRGRR